MIEVRNLEKNYDGKVALNNISFDVDKGDIFGFLGPNGAGKTTTVKIMTGQLLPSHGTVRIFKKDIKTERQILKEQGVVPENVNLYERLTIGQNLEFFCRLYECSTKNVDYFLEEVELLKEKNTVVKKLSKGMKQRVLLIRSLLHKPKILFLDEPTSGLDPVSADRIHALLLKLNSEGTTIFITSHNMEEVDKLCNKIAFLHDGVIVESGNPEQLKLKYSNGKMRVITGNKENKKETLIDMNGTQSASHMMELMQNGEVLAVHSCEPTLGEIFVKVTGRDFK